MLRSSVLRRRSFAGLTLNGSVLSEAATTLTAVVLLRPRTSLGKAGLLGDTQRRIYEMTNTGTAVRSRERINCFASQFPHLQKQSLNKSVYF